MLASNLVQPASQSPLSTRSRPSWKSAWATGSGTLTAVSAAAGRASTSAPVCEECAECAITKGHGSDRHKIGWVGAGRCSWVRASRGGRRGWGRGPGGGGGAVAAGGGGGRGRDSGRWRGGGRGGRRARGGARGRGRLRGGRGIRGEGGEGARSGAGGRGRFRERAGTAASEEDQRRGRRSRRRRRPGRRACGGGEGPAGRRAPAAGRGAWRRGTACAAPRAPRTAAAPPGNALGVGTRRIGSSSSSSEGGWSVGAVATRGSMAHEGNTGRGTSSAAASARTESVAFVKRSSGASAVDFANQASNAGRERDVLRAGGALAGGLLHAFHDAEEQGVDGLVGEGVLEPVGLPGEHRVSELADRVEIGGRADRARAGDLLGRHVHGGAHVARLGRAGGRSLDDLGDAEIEDLDAGGAVVAAGEEDVLWLEIAVDDAGRVHLVERARGLHEERDDVGGGQRAAREDLAEVLAAQELHHEEREARGLVHAGVEGLHDVLAHDVGGDRRLTPEALDDLRVVGEPREQDLQRAAAAGAAVDDLVDRAHRAGVDAADDLELGVKDRAFGEGEGVGCCHAGYCPRPSRLFQADALARPRHADKLRPGSHGAA
jgi:hypothetical protein